MDERVNEIMANRLEAEELLNDYYNLLEHSKHLEEQLKAEREKLECIRSLINLQTLNKEALLRGIDIRTL
ncbi:hypothetical protein [Priestia megaterium]|uniref:hypothetical protein n=1 Tax=Priestia megaterium TaxID=1404 RepID=UPI002E236F70|nr:hypothetical protein [Priestia megaterium]MED4102173.1 hypothetical protein [Priestia megaterium]MED4142600.1 hypothetical protein [Priestia megaterium]